MNLLITGAWQQAEEYFDDIKQKGHNIVFHKYEKDTLPCDTAWVEGIIGNGLFLYHSIESFINLKYIQLTSAGYDRVPMEYINDNNIKIFNARGVYSIPMSEYAVAGVLYLIKKMNLIVKNQEMHSWDKQRNLLELYGKKVAIIGCGSVGVECAKRFKAFGMNTIGVDIISIKSEYFDYVSEIRDLDNVLKIADIVILTLPLTERTKHLINSNRFEIMKQNSIFVNISRGGLVESNSLINALNNNLLGAVLDVFETEPLAANDPLWDLKNVIISPHNSFVGEGNNKRLSEVIMSNLNIYMNGE